MSLSLGKKLVTGGTLMVVLPILVLGIFSYNSASDGLTTQARGTAAQIAQRVTDLTELAMEDQKSMAEALAATDLVIKTTSMVDAKGAEACQAEARELDRMLGRIHAKNSGKYEGLFVAGKDGIAFSESKGKPGVNVFTRPYFKTAMSGKLSIGDVVKSRRNGKPLAIIAAPVNSGGKTVGVMVITVNTDFLVKKVSGFKVGKTGYAWLADKNGTIISHPNQKIILKENINNLSGMEEIARKMLAGQSGVMGYKYNGVAKTCGFAPVPLTGWALAFTQDDDEFMGAVYQIRNGVAILGGIALLAAVLIVVFFARGITKPVMRVVAGLSRASDEVSTGSKEVAASSQQLAEGASQQAASIEETSASLEEITSMTRQNADNAQEAKTLTDESNRVVSDASGIMEELTGSMEAISSASDETSKIIKTIDEIAFQTNLLALNAAVEAARAGEAGAGFAVVADEVRNLAMRAAEAAKSTQELIENTVQRVHTGGSLVSRADEAFTKVLESSRKVDELIGEIAAASKEQAQGVDQINQAVGEMDKVTQTVAANAEESAASSEEMNGQARSMHEFVGQLTKVVTGKNASGAPTLMIEDKPAPRAGTKALLGMNKKTKAKAKAPAAAAAPREEIPFDDDADFRDF